ILKLKSKKQELKLNNQHLEEELEKLNQTIDNLKAINNNELKVKDNTINELKDIIKCKDLEIEELNNCKLQLDNEISLYKQILSEAEKEFHNYEENSPRVNSSPNNSELFLVFNNKDTLTPI